MFIQKPIHNFFTEVLFIITPNWKQLSYPLLDEWLNKQWCIPTMKYYSAIKMKKALIHTTTWMNHQRTMLSEYKSNPKRCIM